MKTYAISNQKGGSGKTTTTVNLAAALGELRRRVLIVDLDPQANASTWHGVFEGGKDLLEVLTEGRDLAGIVRPTGITGVDLAPSSPWMVGAEKILFGDAAAETIIKRRLNELPAKWDMVLIDTPPHVGTLTISALAAADAVIIPVEAHVMALKGLAQLLQTIEAVKERLNPALEIAGVVACRVDLRTRHGLEVVDDLRGKLGGKVFKTIIRENVRVAEAPSFGQPVTLYAPDSTGAADYRALAKELLKVMH